jgi:regulator of protease activity HflC (stomatin/prohibitin superfamily)
MTSTTDYTETTRRIENAFTTTLETWKNSLNSVTDQFRAFPTVAAFPQLDATEAVERQFAFIKQVVDLNHDYAFKLAEVANTLTGVTRQQIESVSTVVRDQAQSLSEAARTGVDKVEQAVADQADQAEKAEREARAQAEKAEREARAEAAKAERVEQKKAQDDARARYEGLNKAELADEAGKRNLAKTGTVDELVARLVEDDTK